MIDLLLDAMACYRATRLVTRDTVTRPLRARIIRWAYQRQDREQDLLSDGDELRTEAEWDELPHSDDDAPKLAALVVCPYCMGIWCAFGVIVARRYARGVWEPVARGLALSAATALIGGLEVE